MPVALWTSANSSVRPASPSRSRWSRRGMPPRLRIRGADALGKTCNNARGWTNVWRGLAAPRVSGGPAQAARPAVDLEPDHAAAVGAVEAPAARELRQRAQAEALDLDLVRVEPPPRSATHAREVRGQAREEHDPLVAAGADVTDGVLPIGRRARHATNASSDPGLRVAARSSDRHEGDDPEPRPRAEELVAPITALQPLRLRRDRPRRVLRHEPARRSSWSR